MHRRALVALLTVLFALPGVGLAADDRLQVVATTGMIADAARQVGGEEVEVRALMGPGVDPHSYRQTRTDIVAMTRADLVLWHGLYLEAQMEEFLHDLGRKRNVVAVADALPRDLLLAHEDYPDKFDPHVWMVPDLWKEVVLQVQAALIETRPESAEIFAANAAAHLDEIDRLAAYARASIGDVPPENRVLLTAHDAFGYFGQAYGVEVIGIQGISTESEAGLNRISALVDLLVERNITAVFVETSVSDRNIRALIEGAGARGHEVRIGGELFSDAMGAEDTYEGSYVGMIDHNVTTIARALGADVPARGMSGRLSAGS
ncbi:metal ABC transporter solute-binding protein, Zn/Mn family [Sedimentitalea arenosa]|jgi:manganese/zinc/iron transport system substrate-binding protein|uniref:Zinc ABC transporter substrate-binding protein n=1 Tax=Sedimentitalea arenosa TaxID=2798803 RepID=A0A8J7IWF2_9RHOB|nr:zinc ABC transporter substrate-binding protein [Arenibacterium arenosum]MBJ6372822.1 zinc ABC transporter substrate-binding protein [Arenibacterium arenosum]